MNRRRFLAISSITPLIAPQLHAAARLSPPLPAADVRWLDLLRVLPDTPSLRSAMNGEVIWSDNLKQAQALLPADGQGPTAIWNYQIMPDFQLGISPDDRETFMKHVDQSLSLQQGHPDEQVHLINGVSDPETLIHDLENRPYDEITRREGITTFVAQQLNLRGGINSSAQLNLVVTDSGIVASFPQRDALLDFTLHYLSPGPSLADRAKDFRHWNLPTNCVTLIGIHGSMLALARMQFNPAVDATMRNRIRAPFLESDQIFGVMPEILRLSVGWDAGHNGGNLRSQNGPYPVLPPYSDPISYVYTQFADRVSAERAAEIIAWRWENMVSFVNGDSELGQLFGAGDIAVLEEDPTVIRQVFKGYPGAKRVQDMILRNDLVIYGWGNFSE